MNYATFTFRGINVLVIELESELWFNAKDIAMAINHSNYRNMAEMVSQESVQPLHIAGKKGCPSLFLRQIGLLKFFNTIDRTLYEDLVDLAELRIWPWFAEPIQVRKSPEKPYSSKLGSKAPTLRVKAGTVFANSQDVAEFFGKRHDHVLRDIRELQATLTPENRGAWFHSIMRGQTTGFGTRQVATFDMTRDGFAMLSLGSTGEKAVRFKERFIEEFNRTERELQKPKPKVELPDFTNPAIAARAWADEVEQKHQLLEENAQLKEKLNILRAENTGH